jgi:uncharacterized protein YbaR (Trm112 family)
MFVELIDRLRCPNDHEETWLVAAAARTANRHLLDATLGCPVCDAEFTVRDGAVLFGDPRHAEPMMVDEGEALRAAALLAAREHGLYLLEGGWAALADALFGVVPVGMLLIDPPVGTAAHEAGGALLGVGNRWPLAPSSVDGAALVHIEAARLADIVRVLRPRGRLVAPAHAPVPVGIAELARDDRHWVGEKLGDVVGLSRARR